MTARTQQEILGHRSADEPGCRPPKPVLVSVEHVPPAALDQLADVAHRSGVRLYEARDGRPGSLVLAGQPEAFAALRTRLLPLRSLDFVREAVEGALAGAAEVEAVPRLTSEAVKLPGVAEDVRVPTGTALLVSREFTFDAAHNLPRYQGKCERLHGHTFRLRVTVKAPLDTWSGMAFDFHDLKKSVESRVIKVLDHSYVNEVVPNPSAEFIAVWVWDRLADLPLHEIKVWETPTCHVTYHGPPDRAERGG